MNKQITHKKDSDAITIGVIFIIIYIAALTDHGINMTNFMKCSHLVFGPIASFVVYQITDNNKVRNAIIAGVFPAIALLYFGVKGKKV